MTAELFEASCLMAHRLGLELAKQKLIEGYAKALWQEDQRRSPGLAIYWQKEAYEGIAKGKLEALL
ncbi:MAG TPA: hypothetical protein VN455_11220 [Methanotrichaceae archaeon]|nr:hypothetical protein [Methanotrichaceae archaeon]